MSHPNIVQTYKSIQPPMQVPVPTEKDSFGVVRRRGLSVVKGEGIVLCCLRRHI